VGPLSDYKGESVDSETATWANAHDTCVTKGGHLARATELGELISQGLPNGSGAWLWTSDQVGYNSIGFLAAIKRWDAIDLMHFYGYPKDLSWDYRTGSYPFRCIYYPVDTSYTGPAASDCAGGCFEVTMPGTSQAKIWVDSFDRTSAAALGAIDGCRQLGGHLASERDLTEAIRAGLPNGSGSWISSSDLSIGGGQENTLLVGIVKWTATDPAFDDQYSTYSTWGYAYESRPYRCMWTNELR
jgi:hypothetical protein